MVLDDGRVRETVVDTSRLNASASAEERSRQAIEAREHVVDFQRARLTLRVGVVVWSSFAAFDLVQATYGRGDLEALLAIRVAMALFLLLLVAWIRIDRKITRFKVELGLVLSGVLMSASVAFMCLYSGGFESFYLPGITLIMFSMITVPRPFSKNALWMALVFAPYPLVLFGSTLFIPHMQLALHEPRAMAAVAQYHFVGIATGALVCVLSHNIWLMRRELYESQGIGRYRLTRLLGKGGMGEVWAAQHKDLRREVAVKILQRNDDDTGATKRFEREIYAIAALSHPNTVRLHDYGVADDGRLYYAMELLEGETVKRLVQREGPLDPARAMHLVLQAASALAEAHDRGIVHRDAKPENLFVTQIGGREFLKVLDFGIASIQGDPRFAVTRTGVIAGTPGTISPEVAVGEPATPASDVYALGAVSYLLLTGQMPFGSAAGNASLLASLNERPRPPSRVLGQPLPRDVEDIVLRCLERDPAARFDTARELARVIERCSVLQQNAPRAPSLPARLTPSREADTDRTTDTREDEPTRLLGNRGPTLSPAGQPPRDAWFFKRPP